MSSVKILVVISDPDISEKSLCRNVAQFTINSLKSLGHTVTVTDLPKDGWNDVLSVKDFTKLSDPIHINMRLEQQISPLIQKIKDEQARVFDCDILMIMGPVSWFGLPAHFYAWWERVFTCGAMYSPGTLFSEGAFSKKRAIVVGISPNTSERFGSESINGKFELVVYPITHGMLHTVGFKVCRSQHLIFPPEKPMNEILGTWSRNLQNLQDRTLIPYNKSSAYLNWQLNTPENERRNDFQQVNRYGDMGLLESQ
jgi:NAD(P)H dehydrogenase (quinone)